MGREARIRKTRKCFQCLPFHKVVATAKELSDHAMRIEVVQGISEKVIKKVEANGPEEEGHAQS